MTDLTAGSLPSSPLANEVHTKSWYALTVRHQHERKVATLLEQRGWETLTPVYTSDRQWSDRVKQVEMPLFGGYVFCRFPMGDRMFVEDTPGVIRVVQFGGAPAPLLDREIEEIRMVAESKLKLTPWPYLSEGDRVEVRRGPLRGLEGTLLESTEADGGKTLRLIVSVVMLQRSVAVELAPEMIVPLPSRSFARGAGSI